MLTPYQVVGFHEEGNRAGSRGLSAAGFIAQGARVYISSRKAGVCEETAAELSRNGGTCIPLPQDISTIEAAKLLGRAYCEREPKLDILVNNAGAAWLDEFDAGLGQGHGPQCQVAVLPDTGAGGVPAERCEQGEARSGSGGRLQGRPPHPLARFRSATGSKPGDPAARTNSSLRGDPPTERDVRNAIEHHVGLPESYGASTCAI